MVVAYHLGEIVNRAESHKHPLIFPRGGHEKCPVIPHSPDVVPEIP